MWPNPQFPADLVTFAEETLNGKLYFLCSKVSNLLALLVMFWFPLFVLTGTSVATVTNTPIKWQGYKKIRGEVSFIITSNSSWQRSLFPISLKLGSYSLQLCKSIFERLPSYAVTLARKCSEPVREKVKQRFLTKKGLRHLFKVNNKRCGCFKTRQENVLTANSKQIFSLQS